jgi:hypothetical protein
VALQHPNPTVESGQEKSTTTAASQSDHAAMFGEKKKHYGVRMIFNVTIMCLGTVSYSYSAGVIATTVGQPSWYE